MKKITPCIFLIISIIANSCQNANPKLELFEGFKERIDSKVFQDFPIKNNNLGNPYFLSVDNPSIRERKHSSLFITYQMEDNAKFDSELSKYVDIKKQGFDFEETNVYRIPDSLSLSGKPNFSQTPPVPSLTDSLGYLKKIVNPKKSKIAIIDYKEGDFFRKPFDLPNESYSSKGFSEGVIADYANLYITYWVLVW